MTSTTVDGPCVLWRIEVSPRPSVRDVQGDAVLHDVRELGLDHVSCVRTSRIFLLEGGLSRELAERICGALLADPISERYVCQTGGDDATLPGPGFDAAIEVRLKGGVMDPVAASTLSAVADMGIDVAGLRGATGRLFRLAGLLNMEEAEWIAQRLLFNDCIEEVYLSGFGRHDARPSRLPIAPQRTFQLRHVPLRDLDDAALLSLSREAHLFLSLAEMHTIQRYYRELGRDPTDLEVETLAQTWSEHCVHKTLKSSVEYTGAPMPFGSSAIQERLNDGTVRIRYGNLLKDTIAAATQELIRSGRASDCLSVFVDNAGIIAFDDRYGVAFKVETHNHPSAIEPYGGAATGVGGVIRDILGCGLGAKPIANTDVFCFAPPDFPLDLLPKGVLHPRRVFKGVVGGVRDYGNRMGIPTVNGAIHFDDRYLGNPLVFCGCIGLIPRDRIDKQPRPGDLVVVMGGRTGRDGIHGATFSSAELTDTHADEFSHAVQIGDAITEKRVLDALMQARDHASGCLYTAVTDCGAGGLSSAVGEMAATLGAEIELDQVPLKYAGLSYDEIWISEAQERMVLSVPAEQWPTFEAICRGESVEAKIIGKFRGDGRLIVRYRGAVVGELEVHFLHEGVPRSSRSAAWSPEEPPALAGAASPPPRREQGQTPLAPKPSTAPSPGSLLGKLAALDTASKEWVIRQYDHEVQGASVIKPLVGPGQGPSDGAVIRPCLDSHRGIAIANGMDTALADTDPYWMAVAGIDEAIRNIVCVGGDPQHTAILDNFCWGNCDDPRTMGGLVRACQGAYDAALAYGTPFISGKDSLNNEFALDAADAHRLAGRIPLHNHRIRIPGTLLISAISVIEDVAGCITMDAKPLSAGASVFCFVGLKAGHWQDTSIAAAARLHQAVADVIRRGWVLAAHDVGQEGVAVALAEMALAGQVGIEAIIEQVDGPVVSGYVLQIQKGNATELGLVVSETSGAACEVIGELRSDTLFICQQGAASGTIVDISQLSAAWRSTLSW